jgi:ankyrin repeat protein
MNDDKSKRAEQLIDAIDKNDIATASSLISGGFVNLNGEPWPLHHAARDGRVEIMSMLLDAGADINAADHNRHAACFFAIKHDQFDALKLLVERGANLGVVNSKGRSLLATVARYGRSELFVVLLLDAGTPLDGLTPFHLMRLVKCFAVFNRLMARGVNVTAMRDDLGCSLCHYVARSVTRAVDLRHIVNACGSDAIYAVESQGATPFHLASSSGNESAIRVLVELGADIDRQDNDGWTALHYAAANMQSSCVDLLIALGADIGLGTDSGRTACHFAALYDRPASMCAVVAAGGDLDRPDNYGETSRTIVARKNVQLPTTNEVDAARREIAKTRLDLVRHRAFQICLGLHPLGIDVLQLCEVLMHSFGALSSLILFHQWWAMAIKVKHFRDHKQAIQAMALRNPAHDAFALN